MKDLPQNNLKALVPGMLKSTSNSAMQVLLAYGQKATAALLQSPAHSRSAITVRQTHQVQMP